MPGREGILRERCRGGSYQAGVEEEGQSDEEDIQVADVKEDDAEDRTNRRWMILCGDP